MVIFLWEVCILDVWLDCMAHTLYYYSGALLLCNLDLCCLFSRLMHLTVIFYMSQSYRCFYPLKILGMVSLYSLLFKMSLMSGTWISCLWFEGNCKFKEDSMMTWFYNLHLIFLGIFFICCIIQNCKIYCFLHLYILTVPVISIFLALKNTWEMVSLYILFVKMGFMSCAWISFVFD